jgi:hypothetical protein
MTNTTSSKHSKANKGPTLGGLTAVGRPWMSQGHKHDVVYRIKKNKATKQSAKANHRIKPKRKKK